MRDPVEALFPQAGGPVVTTYSLRLPPQEVVRLVRAEIDAASDDPELYESAYQDYVIEEDYDRRAYGLADDEQYDLVTSEAVMNIEPRIEQNYWVLSVIVHKDLGPQVIADENAFIGVELSLDAFESQFVARDDGTVRVYLEAATPAARRHFDRWWQDLSARHPVPAGKPREGRPG